MDINLKLAIISCLNNFGLYIDEAKKLKSKVSHGRPFKELGFDDIVPEVYDYYKNLELEDNHLNRITEFNPSASNDCYLSIVKEWSGEDDIFDIVSLNGIEQLPNLEIFNPFGLLDWDIDINALVHCKNLKIVYTEFIPKTKENQSILDELQNKGVKLL